MQLWVSIALAAGFVAAAVLAYYPLLVEHEGRRRLAALGLGMALLPLPLLVPGDRPASGLVRFLLAVVAVLYAWRFYDLHVGFPKTGRPPLRRYLAFMGPGVGHAVYRRVGTEPGPGLRGNLGRLLRGSLELTLGGAAAYALFRVFDVGRTSFLLEHCAKWLALYVAIDGALLVVVAGHRLVGLDALDVYRDPIASRTPAELWRRYNRMVGEWLFMNVFRRGRLRRRPVLATLATFLVSGLMHEYLFSMALLEVQGYQLAFFLLHGVASASTLRLRPSGWKAALGIAGTLAFTLATLILFTASVDAMLAPLLPFYAHGRPALWAG